VTCGTIDLEFNYISLSIPDLLNDGSALIFAPGIGTGEGMSQTRTQLEVSFPGAKLKIKIVLTIAFWLFTGTRSATILLRCPVQWLNEDGRTTQQKIEPNASEHVHSHLLIVPVSLFA
jgi:hypothetical protein